MKMIILLSVLISAISTDEGWKKEKEKEGIVIFSKKEEGASIKSVKAEMDVESSPEAVLKVVGDIEKFPEWIYKCSKAEILNKKNAEEIEFYQINSAPFPVKSRDMVILMKISKNEKGYYVGLEAINGKKEKVKGMVRITHYKGFWEIQKTGNKTHIVNYLNVDPENLPSWIINRAISEGPYQTMISLRKKLKN